MGFADDVKAAIAMLGGPEGDRVVDFLADPGAACRALDAVPEHGGLVARVALEPGAAAAGYGPAPGAPLWIRVMRGAREVGTVPLLGGDGMVRRARHVELATHEESCCDAPGCGEARVHAAVWLVLEPIAEPDPRGGRLLVAEQRTRADGGAGADAARAVAARLATALGVPLQRDGEAVEIAAGEAPLPLGEALPAAELARFALQREGDRVVLRDWDSKGPRASARRNAWIGGALVAVAAVGWYQLWRALGAGGSTSAAIASGVVGALFTLAGYAFLGVARFSAKYRARSAPLLAVGRDRIIVAPWVSRDGAVDARPEGRLGAALSLGEVRAASPKPLAAGSRWRLGPRAGEPAGVAVELDTDHGPIDAMVCPTEATAKLWCAALERILDEARHPRQGATARQRARQRAAATA